MRLRISVQAHFSAADIATLDGCYDLVVANLYAEVLIALAPDIIRLTGSYLALAGILLIEHSEYALHFFSPQLCS